MKKILMSGLFLASSATLLHAEQWSEKLVEFLKLSKEHKGDWINFCKKMQNGKKDLMWKQKQEWFDFKINNIGDIKNTTLSTATDKNEFFKTHLMQALDIRKKHDNEWKEFHDNAQKEGYGIWNRHQQALQSFEDSLGITAGIGKKAGITKATETMRDYQGETCPYRKTCPTK